MANDKRSIEGDKPDISPAPELEPEPAGEVGKVAVTRAEATERICAEITALMEAEDIPVLHVYLTMATRFLDRGINLLDQLRVVGEPAGALRGAELLTRIVLQDLTVGDGMERTLQFSVERGDAD